MLYAVLAVKRLVWTVDAASAVFREALIPARKPYDDTNLVKGGLESQTTAMYMKACYFGNVG